MYIPFGRCARNKSYVTFSSIKNLKASHMYTKTVRCFIYCICRLPDGEFGDIMVCYGKCEECMVSF